MARKPEPPKPENHERWIISYADFITLLFAAFVALYAVSSMDKSKAAAASESLHIALEGPLIDKLTFKKSAPRVPTYESRSTPKSSAIQSAEENCIGGPGRRIQQSPNNKLSSRQGGVRQMQRLKRHP